MTPDALLGAINILEIYNSTLLSAICHWSRGDRQHLFFLSASDEVQDRLASHIGLYDHFQRNMVDLELVYPTILKKGIGASFKRWITSGMYSDNLSPFLLTLLNHR